MKLYTYQEELLNSKEKTVLMNWARGSGSTYALVQYIAKNKPKRVLIADKYKAKEIFEALKKEAELTKDFTISKDPVSGNMQIEEFDITFVVHESPWITRPIGFNVDLAIVFDIRDISEYVDAEHTIYTCTVNINNEYFTTSRFGRIIVVDYKDFLKENFDQQYLNNVIEMAREHNNSFYNEYSIKDKPKKKKIEFTDFQHQAMQSLMEQFLKTGNASNTVMTRMNIMSMIKDLKEIGK